MDVFLDLSALAAAMEKEQTTNRTKQQSSNKTKKAKAHRRRQQRKRRSKAERDDTLMTIDGKNNSVKSTRKQSRSEKANYKRLVRTMKNEQNPATKQKKTKKTKANRKKGSDGVLPEELAYKRSLRLNRKEHAKKAETQGVRSAVGSSLDEKIDNLKKEVAEKRQRTLLVGPLPEERAYRLSIGHAYDACL